MQYFYASHLTDRYFIRDHKLSYEERHCETCFDTDAFLGAFKTLEDFLEAFPEYKHTEEDAVLY